MSKRIALFGGSFNPPHEGHREIARRVARRRTIDEVWILPVFRHPLGKRLPPFSKRLADCKRFFRGLGGKVKVKDWERRLGATSYTARLIRELKKRYPTAEFSLVIGSDAYRERRLWRDFSLIRKEVRLIVFPRGRGSPIPNISSTEIRKRRR